MKENNYDVVIVGGGPAGLSAGIYTSRRAMSTLIVSKDVGGQAALTDEIENYPGFESVGGLDLSYKFKDQAVKFGCEFISGAVAGIEKKDDSFTVSMANGESVQAATIILAFGLTPRNLEVPGEKELTGKGVSYCATCDGPLYKGKDAVVIGGGNSALDAAEYLSKICNKVYLINRKDKFRGEQILIDHVNEAKNVEVIYSSNTVEIKGKERVEALVYKGEDGKTKELTVQGIFIEIGHVAKTDWLKNVVELNDRREIVVSADNETNTPGIFAAGDVTQISYKQVVISAGEGAKAALQAYKYKQGNKPLAPDWTTKKK